ncbi:MAG: phosphoglycerate kinase, partial [Synergistaceae bacterium]|nr:phosphoglycerate kinase [Synergistaceae bacterium]
MRLKTFGNNDISGKKVLVRVDFNVPLAKDGSVADATRIRAHMPLIDELASAGAKISLCSHLGRPKGQAVAKYSLKPVADELGRMTDKKVIFSDDCVGDGVPGMVESMSSGNILVLENLRFYPDEEKNGDDFARRLAAPFDVFVMDAFSAAHRAHASTRAIVNHIKSFAGPLLIREIEMLSEARDNPKRPFVLVLGGAKVSDKIGVIENMLDKIDTIIIGGGMAFTFLKAEGMEVGRSICETERLDFAGNMLDKAREKGVSIILPKDVIVADEVSADAVATVVSRGAIPADKMGLDIGPESVSLFRGALGSAKTVLWNGPMGVFEMAPFAGGTRAIAEELVKITKSGSFT